MRNQNIQLHNFDKMYSVRLRVALSDSQTHR